MSNDTQPDVRATPEGRTDYWDEYYAARSTMVRRLPSQFAVFVAGELEGRHRIIELGCGNGRDSMFFASHGHEVVAVDASQAAIDGCRALADTLGERAAFISSRIEDPALPSIVRGEA